MGPARPIGARLARVAVSYTGQNPSFSASGGCIAMRFAWIETLMFSLLIASAVPAFAADDGKDADSSQDKDKKKDEKPVPPEKTAVSHGSVDVGGRSVHYTATAGNVIIREDKEDKPE
ncbi:MAG TPA: hypothetical protein VJ696_05310, partial [Rhodanobacteraceae bacterium]|nr:hypothetical protein [Rhodanobacteraceae bacterium]